MAALGLALLLGACATTFDALPEKLGGLPENAPARPAQTGTYPNVYEPVQPREVKPLTAEEQKKLESDLLALRESQTQRANAPDQPPPPPPPPPKQAAPKKPPEKKTAAKKPPDNKPPEPKQN